MADLTTQDQYLLLRQQAEQKRLDDFAKASAQTATPVKGTPLVPIEQVEKEYNTLHPLPEEEELIQPGKDPEQSFIENMLLSLTDPVEWPGLVAGGATQAARAGKPVVAGAIDWATLGIPSLAKGIKGFGKNVIRGLGAKAREAAIPVGKAMPIAAETISPSMSVAGAKSYEEFLEKNAFKKAVRDIEGKIHPGKPGEIHAQMAERVGYDKIDPRGGDGYIGKDGEFYTRDEIRGFYFKASGTAASAESIGKTLNEQILETSKKVNDLAKNWDTIIEKARRGTISHEQAVAMGKNLGTTVDDIRKLYPGTAMNAEQASALVGTIKPMADDTIKAAQRFLKTNAPGDLHEALYKFYALMQVDPKRFGVLAEAGRTLSQMNEPISGVNQYLNQFSKAFSNMGPEGLTPDVLVKMIAEFKDPGQLAIMARHVNKPGGFASWKDALLEGWTMGLLSAPKTHLVNATSNMITTIMGIGERSMAPYLAFGKGSHVVHGEALEMIYGVTHAFGDALKMATSSFKSGVSQFGTEKAELITKRAISSEALGLNGVFGRAVDFLGNATRIPGRALVAADDFSKVINYQANLRALALRTGNGKGLEGNTLANFVEDFVKNPPFGAATASRDYANYMTFTKELDGLALSIQQGLVNHPTLRVVVPFWRTPVNIFKFSLERTPVLNALSNQLRSEIVAGGPQRDLALAKIAMGSMICSTAYILAKAGYITGSGPSNKEVKNMQRQAGWQPDSIKIGNEFISYTRLDPVSQLLGTVADLAEMSDEIDQPRIDQMAMALTLGYMNHATTKTYLEGISRVFEAIKQPDQQGLDYIKKWTGSLVPTIVRHAEQQIDPTIREAAGFLDQIRSELPGFSSSLPPRRNLKGEAIVSEGAVGPDMLSFLFKSTVSQDPVWQEIIQNKIPVSDFPRSTAGARPPKGLLKQETTAHGVEFTPEERDWLIRMAGNEMKIDGKGMWDTLTELVRTPEYQQATPGPDGSRAILIKSVINQYRDLAIAKLRGISPKLNQAILDKEESRIRKLTRQGD